MDGSYCEGGGGIMDAELYELVNAQEIKIANLICENHRLKGLLNDAGIAYVYDVKSEERGIS